MTGGSRGRIREASWSDAAERAAISEIRRVVFIVEQEVPEEVELDGSDESCRHWLALDSEDRPIATARLRADGHLGRIAVLEALRGKGIGAETVRQVLRDAATSGLSSVDLDSQVAAIGFYQALGFQKRGEVFMEAGIPHQNMTLSLREDVPRKRRARGAGHWLFRVLLTIPAVVITARLMTQNLSETLFEELLHATGETCVRLLIIALLVSPLALWWPRNRALRFLRAERRTLGLASFAYAALHLAIYATERSELAKVVGDLSKPTYVAGWVGLIVMIPLALTSTDAALRRMGGGKWRRLHQLAYVAAVAGALHWLLKPEGSPGPVLVHFGPLVVLEALRLYRNRSERAA